jgi:hypothetical protein
MGEAEPVSTRNTRPATYLYVCRPCSCTFEHTYPVGDTMTETPTQPTPPMPDPAPAPQPEPPAPPTQPQ